MLGVFCCDGVYQRAHTPFLRIRHVQQAWRLLLMMPADIEGKKYSNEWF